MELITVTNGVLVAVIIALTQILKKYVPEKFVTVVPLILGILGAGFLIAFTAQGILTGLILGLTASGLYDQKQVVTD